MKNIYHWIRKNSATILSVIAAGGVIGTAYLSGKGALKSNELLKRKRETEKEITKRDEILTKAEAFLPAGAAAAGTILCILGANALNQKRQALLLTTCAYYETLKRRFYDEKRDGFENPGLACGIGRIGRSAPV